MSGNVHICIQRQAKHMHASGKWESMLGGVASAKATLPHHGRHISIEHLGSFGFTRLLFVASTIEKWVYEKDREKNNFTRWICTAYC